MNVINLHNLSLGDRGLHDMGLQNMGLQNMGLQNMGLGDPRLAPLLVSAQPAWLWSPDGTAILWANATGIAALKLKGAAPWSRSPTDSHRRQIARLGRTLEEAPRLERLPGFGAPLGQLCTCACTRLALANGSTCLLIAAVTAPARPQPVAARVETILASFTQPAAAFAADGALLAANRRGRRLFGAAENA